VLIKQGQAWLSPGEREAGVLAKEEVIVLAQTAPINPKDIHALFNN
jgi:hypothetical protein